MNIFEHPVVLRPYAKVAIVGVQHSRLGGCNWSVNLAGWQGVLTLEVNQQLFDAIITRLVHQSPNSLIVWLVLVQPGQGDVDRTGNAEIPQVVTRDGIILVLSFIVVDLELSTLDEHAKGTRASIADGGIDDDPRRTKHGVVESLVARSSHHDILRLAESLRGSPVPLALQSCVDHVLGSVHY